MKCRLGLLCLFLVGCQQPHLTQRSGYQVNTRHSAMGQQPRIRQVVLHYTAEDNQRSLEVLTQRKVSAHYLVPRNADPKQSLFAYQLVPEQQAAWHAGLSYWRGFTSLNTSAIGIEIVNQGYFPARVQHPCQAYTPAQLTLVSALLKDIIHRYQIKPWNVLGHSDIAPLRKRDPGPCFPWQWFAKQGIGAWPNDDDVNGFLAGKDPKQPVDNHQLLPLLKRYGYQINEAKSEQQVREVVRAFQLHFQPENYSGQADELTLARIKALLKKYRD